MLRRPPPRASIILLRKVKQRLLFRAGISADLDEAKGCYPQAHFLRARSIAECFRIEQSRRPPLASVN